MKELLTKVTHDLGDACDVSDVPRLTTQRNHTFKCVCGLTVEFAE